MTYRSFNRGGSSLLSKTDLFSLETSEDHNTDHFTRGFPFRPTLYFPLDFVKITGKFRCQKIDVHRKPMARVKRSCRTAGNIWFEAL